MKLSKTLILMLLMIGIVLILSGCIDTPQIQVTTTTTTTPQPLNESQLMEKYLNDNKFCIKDSDCVLRCGGNLPLVCDNTYLLESNRNNLICTGALSPVIHDNPTCLCNTSINSCYLIITLKDNTTQRYNEIY
jgi:hypothetical protein